MRLIDAVKRLFRTRDNLILDGIRYGRSRRLMTMECAVSTSISNLVSSVFFVDMVNYLGGTSALTGIINAVPSLTTPLQTVSAFMFSNMKRRKKTVLILSLIVRVIYSSLFFLPVALYGKMAVLPLVIAGVIAYNALNNLAAPGGTNWIVDLVPDSMQSRYFANREGVSLVVLAFFMLFAGGVVDTLQATYGRAYSFIFIGAVIVVLSVADLLILGQVDEPKTMQAQVAERREATDEPGAAGRRMSLKLLMEPMRYKSVRRVMLLSMLWSVSAMFGGPFSGVYQVVNLDMSFVYISVLSVISIVIRVFLTPLSGRIAARIGVYPVMIYSIALIAIHYVLWAFTVKENASFMLPILFVESAVGFAGINFSMFIIQMKSMPEEIRTTAISVTNSIVGLAGFGSTLVASLVVSLLKGATVTLGGFQFCDLQIVFFITAVIMLGCAGYGLALACSDQSNREAVSCR